MSDSNNEEVVKTYLDLSDEELLIKIGSHFAGRGAAGERPERLKQIARKWLDTKNEEIRIAICKNDQIREAAKQVDNHDRRVNLVCILADILAASFVGAPVVSIAVLITREGLEIFCQKEWHKS